MLQLLREEVEADMRRHRHEGIGAIRTAWIPAAFWVLAPVLATLPLQPVRAQESAETSVPLSAGQADAQIASLLAQTETWLDEGHLASPAGANASETFSRVIVLSSSASPAGLQAIADFPSVLKKRADAEQAAGHPDISIEFQIFAEAVTSIIGLSRVKPDTQPAALAQAEPRANTPGTSPLAGQESAATATKNADEIVTGNQSQSILANVPAAEASRNTNAQKPQPNLQTGKPGPAISSPQPTAPDGTSANRTDVSENRGPSSTLSTSKAGTDITTPNASQDAEPPKNSGTTQVATLPPALEANTAPAHDTPEKPGPSLAPAMSPPMIDALLKRGDEMLKIGDISAARLLFARAAESGSGQAVIALGDTYNPVFLAEHGALGLQADAEAAKAWYRKALAVGEPQARERLVELGGGTPADAVGSVNSR